MAKPQKLTSNEKQKEFQIGIANLILTGISLLITTFVGIYLANKNELLQQRMLEWKAQAELAKIKINRNIDNNAPYDYVFSITNNGLSVAKNLKVEICLRGPVYMWNDLITGSPINSIEQFDIFLDNSSIDYRTESRKSTCSFNENIDNNSEVLTISNLPPDEKLIIGIRLKNNLLNTANTGIYDGKVYLIVPSNLPINLEVDQNTLEYPLNQSLQGFLTDHFQVAVFTLVASCDNCAIENNGLTITKTSLLNYSTNNIEVISKNEGSTKLSIDVKAEYLTPKNITASSTGDFYLEGFENKDGIPILSEISSDEFGSK